MCSTLKVDEEPFNKPPAKKRKALDYDDDEEDDDDDNNDDNSSQDEDVSPIKINLKPTRYVNHGGSHLHLGHLADTFIQSRWQSLG